MVHGTMLCVIYAFGVFKGGLAALIQTHPVTAALGEEARLRCQLLQPKRVEQITWKKLSPAGETNLASYTKEFGERVNPHFRDKVKVEVPDLQNISIIIHSVMEQDGGCYKCLFNTLPEGAFIATTCLTVYELHEPILQLESNSSEEVVVTCSATGRPVPTVTLNIPGGEAVSVNNANGTVTVTRTAVLSGFHDNCTQVECAVQVLSVPPRKMFMKLPEVKQPTIEDFNEESEERNRHRKMLGYTGLLVLLLCGFAVLKFLWHRPKTENRDHEMDVMSRTTNEDTQQSESPAAVSEASGQIRQRTPPEMSRTSDNTNPPSNAARKLSYSSE